MQDISVEVGPHNLELEAKLRKSRKKQLKEHMVKFKEVTEQPIFCKIYFHICNVPFPSSLLVFFIVN